MEHLTQHDCSRITTTPNTDPENVLVTAPRRKVMFPEPFCCSSSLISGRRLKLPRIAAINLGDFS